MSTGTRPAQKKTAASSRSAAAAASGHGRRHDLLPLAGEARRLGERRRERPEPLRRATRGSAPHSSPPWSRAPTRRCRRPAHPFVRSFGAFANPTGVAIDHVDRRHLRPRRGHRTSARASSTNSTPGRPVRSELRRKRKDDRVRRRSGLYNFPTQIAVDDDPASPNYRDLYVPEFLGNAVKKFAPSGEQLASLETFESGTERRRGRSRQRRRLRDLVLRSSAVLKSSTPPANCSASSPSSAHSPNPRASPSVGAGNVYVVNGGGTSARKGTTEVYDEAGTWLRTARRKTRPTASRSTRSTITSTSTKATRCRSSTPPAPRSAARPGRGVSPHSVSLAAKAGHARRSATRDRRMSKPTGRSELPRRPRRPTTRSSSTASASLESREDRGLPGHPVGRRRGLHLDPAADRLRQRRGPPGGVPLRHGQPVVDCASCNPTGEQAIGEASLAADGLGLSDDGRVFFNTTEGLVDRDLNEKRRRLRVGAEGLRTRPGRAAVRRMTVDASS